jgi:hypothetical protein
MPTYVYAYLDAKGNPTSERFELAQSMKDAALTEHDGRPVARVPQVPNVAGEWSDTKSKSKLSNKNLERLGFTKYERKGDGVMERVAGTKGPRVISAD